MRQTAFDLMQKIAYYTGQMPDYNYTSFSDTTLRAQLLKYLNSAKQWVVRNVDLDSLIDSTTMGTIASYTTGTVSITQNTTTVTGSGTAFSASMVGRKIRVGGSNTPYKIIKVTDTTHLEIDIPYIETTATGKTFIIFQDVYPLPPFVGRVIAIKRLDYKQILNKKSITWIETRYPDPLLSTFRPYYFATDGVRETRDPLGTAVYTAESGTSTTSIVCSALANTTVQNYYKDWEVYNVTRSLKSRVSGYDISSTTLTLESPITAQVSTDTFYLKKREQNVIFRPTPTEAMPLSVTYLKDATLFYDDTDFESEIDGDFQDILVYQACADFYSGRDINKSATFQAKAIELKDQLNANNEEMPLSNLTFNGGREVPQVDCWGGASSAQAGSYTLRD